MTKDNQDDFDFVENALTHLEPGFQQSNVITQPSCWMNKSTWKRLMWIVKAVRWNRNG